MRKITPLQNRLLTVGAVLGSLCLLVAITAVLVGAKPLVFKSGSMKPTIPTGALGISVPVEAKSIRTGDVISVENAAGVRITHRVVQLAISEDTASVTLQGDANLVPDAEPYVLLDADLVIFHAPLLGYAVAALSSSAGVFAGGLFTAYLLYLAFGTPNRNKAENLPRGGHRAFKAPRRPIDRSSRRAARLTAMAIASASVLSGGALHGATPSQAAFTDRANGTADFAARVLGAPSLTCQNSGNDVILTLIRPPNDFASLYDLRSLVPNASWKSAPWPGNSVSVTIRPSDYNFEEQTQFAVTSSIASWARTSSPWTIYYTPQVSLLFLGLVPANLRCTK